MLISLFSDNTALVAFVRHLYRAHGIVTIADWDAARSDLLGGYPLDRKSRKLFMERVGLPRLASVAGSVVLHFKSRA